MKKISRYFLFFFLLSSIHAFAFDIKDFEKHFKLLPQPQKIELLNGKGIAYNSLQSIFLNGSFSKPVLYGSLRSLPHASKPGPGILVLTLSSGNDLPESPEGYILEIKNDGAILQAKDNAGLFYGCETLLQLLEDAHDEQINIPECTITDYPGI